MRKCFTIIRKCKTNKPLNASNIKDTLNRIIEKINADHPEQYFEHLTPHGLRHTFATNCIEKRNAAQGITKDTRT
ncbi:MAG: site-specific integrase [Lachnospiraceae bacterium]|nr:site-specific integrase [Lachnospiraceae bacterium]